MNHDRNQSSQFASRVLPRRCTWQIQKQNSLPATIPSTHTVFCAADNFPCFCCFVKRRINIDHHAPARELSHFGLWASSAIVCGCLPFIPDLNKGSSFFLLCCFSFCYGHHGSVFSSFFGSGASLGQRLLGDLRSPSLLVVAIALLLGHARNCRCRIGWQDGCLWGLLIRSRSSRH